MRKLTTDRRIIRFRADLREYAFEINPAVLALNETVRTATVTIPVVATLWNSHYGPQKVRPYLEIFATKNIFFTFLSFAQIGRSLKHS